MSDTTFPGAVAPTEPSAAPPQNQTLHDETQMSLGWQWPRGVIGLSFANFFLRLLTAGIYHFWARTEVRKRVWSGVTFNDEPLTYTGRGKELMLGFMIAFVLVLLPLFVLLLVGTVYLDPTALSTQLLPLFLYIPLMFLIGLAIYRARRYQLARTQWRGIRFGLAGEARHYGWAMFWTTPLLVLTLGLIGPWRSVKLQRLITSNTTFGDRQMRFTATAKPLYRYFALFWLSGALVVAAYLFAWLPVAVPIIAAKTGFDLPQIPWSAVHAQSRTFVWIIGGFIALFAIAWIWYSAKMINYFAARTSIENVRIESRVGTLGLIWIAASNFLLTLLGIALILILVFFAMFAYMPPEEWLQFYRTLVQGLSPQWIEVYQQLLSLPVVIAVATGASLFGPIISARKFGYIARRTSISGTLPLAAIEQSSAELSRTGEGLAEAFDVDVFG